MSADYTKIRTVFVPSEHLAVFGYIIAREERQQHQVRAVLQRMLLERKIFLRCAVAVDREVEDLDFVSLKQGACRELFLQTLPESLLQRNFARFRHTVAEYCDPKCSGRLG